MRLLDPKLDIVFKLLMVRNPDLIRASSKDARKASSKDARRASSKDARRFKNRPSAKLCAAFGIELTDAQRASLDDPTTDLDAIVDVLIRERRWP